MKRNIKQEISRRRFIQHTGLASASMLVPGFIKALGNQPFLKADNGRVLVVVQLSGGNDGLNTVIPYQNDIYYKMRPSLSSVADGSLRISGELAFHPSMVGMAELYDQGLLAVINSVGYPNPNRSHFRSMDIWHSGSDADKHINNGWIGRYLDASCKGCAEPTLAVEIDDSLSLAMKGEGINGIALRDPDTLLKSTNDRFTKGLVAELPDYSADSDVSFLYKTLTETVSSAAYLHEKSKIYKSSVAYHDSDFGKRMKLLAELIISGSKTRVYYISLGGFDTHAAQLFSQQRLLKTYADSIKAFFDDMALNGRLNDVLVMTFSEFGRRVKQNASNGTDHGTANNLFLLGAGLKKQGILNEAPNLEDLDNGDLKFQVDFRQVYATILSQWLNVDSTQILGREFPMLDFL